MFKSFLISFSFTLFFIPFFGQNDSISRIKKVRPFIIPTALISSGLYMNVTNSQLNKKALQQKIINKHANFTTNIDDFLPYVPIGQMYLGRAIGLKSRNNFFNQSKQLFLSQFFTSIFTHSLKRLTQVTRPDGSPHSFPSGHTSMAFSSATTLFYEYKNEHPIYASSGFIFASATGGIRVLNNKHWVPDVLVGAAIALLTTHLIYHFEPLKNWNPLKRKKETFIEK